MAINLEVYLNHLEKKHFHFLARDIRQVIHLLYSGKHITVCARVFMYFVYFVENFERDKR